MGHNGRWAFEEKYNWNRMEEKLYEIYGHLMKELESDYVNSILAVIQIVIA